MCTDTGRSRPAPHGFTYVEALLALLIVVVAMGVAMTFFLDFGKALNSESTKSATHYSARIAVDELTRAARQIGYGVRRSDIHNVAGWQRGLVHGGAYELAFNADIDVSVGHLPTSQSLSFATGPSYNGEGIGATQNGAETYVYTLDANGDGAITTADRTEVETGTFNPAGETDNPLDFALFRRVYGFNGIDYGGALEPLSGNLFTGATSDSVFPDSTSPAPLFTYILTEDLDSDGLLSASECVNNVVGNCPPTTARDPVLYLWGDTDFDDTLSESEKTALRSLEVGSAGWAPNPIASSGAYKSTTLSAAASGGGSTTELSVVDGTKFGPGYLIRVGSGAGAEDLTVDAINTASTPNKLVLRGSAVKAHAVGTTVQALPSTLLNAVRAVELNYGAASAERDSANGVLMAGRAGGKGTNGLDYRVTPLRRKIRVLNANTAAAPGLNDAAEICPLKIVNVCSGTGTDNSVLYVGAPSQSPKFLVTDVLDNVIPDISVDLTQSSSTVGVLTSASTLSDDNGLATADYVLTGALGTDTVIASVTCIDSGGGSQTTTATNNLTTYSVDATLDRDCLSTVSTRTPEPKTAFSIAINSSSGPVDGETVGLGLQLDPLYMSSPPDYDAVVGKLWVDGTPIGLTDSGGTLASSDFDTNLSGLIEGSIGLVNDTTTQGARLELIAEIPQQACAGAGATLTNKLDFFKLTLDTIVPAAECSDLMPCVISSGDDVPQVEAELSIGGKPIVDAPLDFLLSDTFADGASIPIPPDTDPPASKLIPGGEILTDSLGVGTVKVSNNGSPMITPMTTLETIVDVQTPGPADMCTNGLVASSSDEIWLDFETPMNVCGTMMLQPYVVKRSDDKMCLHVLNTNNAVDGCPQTIKGVQISIYEADGVTLDPNKYAKIKEMKGGAVTTSASCSNSDEVRLFKDSCKDPKAILDNGEAWMFTDYSDCELPEFQTLPGQFFTFNEIRFDDKFVSGRRMDVTVYFECTDECDGGDVEAATFFLNVP